MDASGCSVYAQIYPMGRILHRLSFSICPSRPTTLSYTTGILPIPRHWDRHGDGDGDTQALDCEHVKEANLDVAWLVNPIAIATPHPRMLQSLSLLVTSLTVHIKEFN